MSAELVTDPGTIAWDARGAWATGRRVSLSLNLEMTGRERVVGLIRSVAATDAYIIIEVEPEGVREEERESLRIEWEELHVPLTAILALHRPHFQEPATWRPRAMQGNLNQVVMDGQLPITSPLPVSMRAADAMMRASRMMLARDLMEVLAAVDRAGRYPETAAVAEEVGRSVRWTSKRLRELEKMAFVGRLIVNRKRRWRVLS